MFHTDIVGERRLLPENQTASLARTESHFKRHGTHGDFGILGV